MTNTSIELTEQEFVALFRLRRNHLDSNASRSCADGVEYMFETYGDEWLFVRRQDPGTVWTLVDDDGQLLILSGCRFVNRIGNLISTVPVPEGMDYCVRVTPEPGDDVAHLEEQE